MTAIGTAWIQRVLETDLRRRIVAGINTANPAGLGQALRPVTPRQTGAYCCCALRHFRRRLSWTSRGSAFEAGLGHGAKFLSRMFPPNIERARHAMEGHRRKPGNRRAGHHPGHLLLALPLSLLGARNMMPGWVSLAGARDRLFVPGAASSHRRHHFRQGRRLRRSGRRVGANGRVYRLHRQTVYRNHRRNITQTSRSRARNRRVVCQCDHFRRPASGVCPLRRLFNLSARFQSAQLDHGGHSGRGRRRRHSIFRIPTLRLRLCLLYPYRDYCASSCWASSWLALYVRFCLITYPPQRSFDPRLT